MESPQLKNLAPRNPLSIIALFISLIYGISATLLGASVKILDAENQTRLVLFIILFPILVLTAFYRLVTTHHRKLYAPSDYRTDESFLQASPQKELGKRLRDEAEFDATSVNQEFSEVVASAEGSALAISHADAPITKLSPTEHSFKINESEQEDSPTITTEYLNDIPDNRVKQSGAYLLMGLAFQEIQEEFHEPIMRDIAISLPNNRAMSVDGWLHNKNLAVEITTSPSQSRIKNSLLRLSYIQRETRNLPAPSLSTMLVIVTDKSYSLPKTEKIVQEQINNIDKSIMYRIYSKEYLYNKYGIS